jgi:hypothetical protein
MTRSDPNIIESMSEESAVVDWRWAAIPLVLISLFVGFIWSLVASSNSRGGKKSGERGHAVTAQNS